MSTLPFLTGIQQAGIGVADLDVSWKWYRRVFQMRVPVFDDAGTAELMTRYTNGIPERRRAVLALNMAGGGGFEIWQYTSRLPVPPVNPPRLGDLGIYALKMILFKIGNNCGSIIATNTYHNGHTTIHFIHRAIKYFNFFFLT